MATLTDPLTAPFVGAVGSPSISGQTILAEAGVNGSSWEDVFVEPAGGWSGTVEPSATLADSSGAIFEGGDRLAISGDTVFAVDDPPLTSFTLRLPRGLSFTKNHARLAAAVSIAGAHDYKLSLEHGGLQVRMPVQAEMLQVQIRPRALAETEAMAHHASTLRKPTANHPVVAFRASLLATDTTGGRY